jgi:mRNA-degrading endonuclease RelE of RelBE toxin-antitoxin system
MNVSKHRSVDAAIRTLSEEERRKVSAWLDHLENWENDEQVRKMSKRTIYQDVYVLNTSDDIRIFFKLDLQNNEISIIDIAKPSRFENVPVVSE